MVGEGDLTAEGQHGERGVQVGTAADVDPPGPRGRVVGDRGEVLANLADDPAIGFAEHRVVALEVVDRVELVPLVVGVAALAWGEHLGTRRCHHVN
jgi:hypothetical protein